MGEERLSENSRKKSSEVKVNTNNESDSSAPQTTDLNNGSSDIGREIALHRIKEKLETFQTNIVDEIQKKMDQMVEDVIQEMRLYELNSSQFKDFAKHQSHQIWNNRAKTNSADGKSSSKRTFPAKVFVPRQSYLTSLLEVNHMRGIYHIFFVIFTVVFMNLFIHDYIVEGSLNFGFGTIQTGCGQFYIAMVGWCCMQVVVLGLYFAFKLWAKVRFNLRKHQSLQGFWSYSCVVAFVIFQLVFGYIPALFCIRFNLPLISSTVVLLEMARFMMKMHAFVRTNAALQLSDKLKVEDSTTNDSSAFRMPSFSSYLFFVFAPTLIYRDNYPRTKQIHWGFAVKNLFEVVAIIFFISFIHERYLRPYFGQFGKEKITVGHLVVTLFGMVAPGLMIFLCGFYCILHAWQNFMAEILRFSDRMFYKDWWTANNFEAYYRDWNIIVHDWLYEYIYKDIYVYVFKGSKTAAQMAVFLISAIVHEYLIAVALRFAYPVLLVFFAGVGLTALRLLGKTNTSIGNFFVWWSLGVGNGLLVALYTIEYYARQNCPVGDSLVDYFIPVSWWCNGIIGGS